MQQRNQIIALWVHPRSMSTATERLMRARGDLDCFHEPFIYYYYCGRNSRTLAHFDVDPSQPTSFDEICRKLESAAEHSKVMFKDMAYYIAQDIAGKRAFLERVQSVFLIRDPRRALLSYYRLDPEFTDEELGLKAQLDLFELIVDISGVEPPVIEAEAIQTDPRNTMAELWKRIDLPWIEHAFSWDTDAAAVPDAWQAVSGWHEDAIKHGSIQPPDPGATEARLVAELAAVFQVRPELEAVLESHTDAYNQLRATAKAFYQSC